MIGKQNPRVRKILDELGRIDGALDRNKSEVDRSDFDDYPVEELWSPGQQSWMEELSSDAPYKVDGRIEGDGLDEGAGAGPDPIFSIPPDIDIETARRLLGDDKFEEVKTLRQIRGIDAFAWYWPFHYPSRQWGIYIPTTGLIGFALTSNLSKDLSLNDACKLSFYAILQHELMHFCVEYVSAQYEIASRASGYISAIQSLRDKSLGFVKKEEELANAYMLQRIKYPPVDKRRAGMFGAVLKSINDHSPPGYRDAVRYFRPPLLDFDYELQRYLESVCSHSGRRRGFPGNKFDFSALAPTDALGKIDWRLCPIFLVNDSDWFEWDRTWAGYFAPIKPIEETVKFKKMFVKLDARIQRKWQQVKRRLGEGFDARRSLDWKAWPKGGRDAWSVRVSDQNYRAHLRRESGRWLAYEIGPHKKLGHG